MQMRSKLIFKMRKGRQLACFIAAFFVSFWLNFCNLTYTGGEFRQCGVLRFWKYESIQPQLWVLGKKSNDLYFACVAWMFFASSSVQFANVGSKVDRMISADFSRIIRPSELVVMACKCLAFNFVFVISKFVNTIWGSFFNKSIHVFWMLIPFFMLFW